MDINELLEVYNGSALMEAGHQEWGYIEEKWYLALPETLKPSDKADPSVMKWYDVDLDGSPFTDSKGGIIDKTIFVKANYTTLKAAGLSDEHAVLGAMMRMCILEMGTLALNPRARNVLVDEYVYVKTPDGGWDSVTLPKLAFTRDIAAWAKRYAPTIMSHIMFVFCARGHHWTPEYVELYQRLSANSFVSNPQGWALPTSEVLYRSIFHCLGVSPLIKAARVLIAKNKLPSSMIIRFKPAPPIAGAAHITTLNAILIDMHRHALWERIRNWKKVEIIKIADEVAEIHSDAYAYHVASKVLCGKERKMVTETAMEAFHGLAPIALGYVHYLGKKHSLYGQKAVTQKYGGVDPLVEMWSDAFEKFGLPSIKKMDVDTFFMEIMDTEEMKQARAKKSEMQQRVKEMEFDLELAQKKAQIQEALRRAETLH